MRGKIGYIWLVMIWVMSFVVSCTPQKSPVVGSITGLPSTIRAGEQIGLSIEASGQDLKYNWSATEGSFSDSTKPSVIYTAPASSVEVVITVSVMSGKETVTKSVKFKVVVPTSESSPTSVPTNTSIPTSTTAPTDTINTPTPTEIIDPTATLTPTLQPFPIFFDGKLAKGYDMGVDTSGQRRDWTVVSNGQLCMNYPSDQQWGSVFVTFGKPSQPPHPWQDLSAYKKLSLELRGSTGGEAVFIGIKDDVSPDDGSETKVLVEDLSVDWKKVEIDLSEFVGTDLTHIYIAVEFVFEKVAETVCVRDIQYLP